MPTVPKKIFVAGILIALSVAAAEGVKKKHKILETGTLREESLLYKVPALGPGALPDPAKPLSKGSPVELLYFGEKRPWAYARVAGHEGWLPLAKIEGRVAYKEPPPPDTEERAASQILKIPVRHKKQPPLSPLAKAHWADEELRRRLEIDEDVAEKSEKAEAGEGPGAVPAQAAESAAPPPAAAPAPEEAK